MVLKKKHPQPKDIWEESLPFSQLPSSRELELTCTSSKFIRQSHHIEGKKCILYAFFLCLWCTVIGLKFFFNFFQLAHGNKTTSQHKQTHGRPPNPFCVLCLLLVFILILTAHCDIEHTAEKSDPTFGFSEIAIRLLSVWSQLGIQALYFLQQRAIFSTSIKKTISGSNGNPVQSQSAYQRTHLGRECWEHLHTHTYARTHEHTSRYLSRPPSCEPVTLHHSSERHLGVLYITNSNTHSPLSHIKKKTWAQLHAFGQQLIFLCVCWVNQHTVMILFVSSVSPWPGLGLWTICRRAASCGEWMMSNKCHQITGGR